ncbi:MAG: hypothetical protein IK116_09140 [Firmicutes bacterium]|nr:hypothetical protein [Bacillota bacterium]
MRTPSPRRDRARRWLPWLLLALAAALCLYGAGHGGSGPVWRKAAVICLECIGLG